MPRLKLALSLLIASCTLASCRSRYCDDLVVGLARWAQARREGRTPTTPPSRIDAELARIRAIADPVDRASSYAGLAERVAKGCPTLQYDPPSESGNRRDEILRELPDRVRACRCAVDIPSIQALLVDLDRTP